MTRALVLGGGGPVGIAWESGLLNGLADRGVDVSQADFIMGTSAGSFVGARLAMGHDPRGFAAPFMAPPDAAPQPQQPRPPRPSGPPADLSALTSLMAKAQASVDKTAAMRELGQFALNATAMSEADFIASFGSFLRDLSDDVWPSRPYGCTAVDVDSGEFKFWTAQAGVGLRRAVASSCAVPGVYPPVTINGRRYMDGGMRSSLNADLAVGHDRVLVIAVRAEAPGAMGEQLKARLDAELDVLRAGGAQVRLLAPDAASLAAMGANLMDFRKRPAAAAAGLAQGQADAAALADFWL